ncbi:putative flagellar hook associated protein [hydrocarbon metagenome]|uniref:Putative flagellar hook associated protein n=1 Tax=hydrocarbon metagenome TaxID=938273 RepID=A0A0W8E4P3_9ZZZZ
MNKVIFPYQPVQPIGTERTKDSTRAAGNDGLNFKQILDKQISPELKFSKHAQQRLKSRNIQLNEQDLQKLQEAVGKAREKGAKDSLILMDKLALVVSIRNNTVITAVDEDNVQDNVFTNIDSAVII